MSQQATQVRRRSVTFHRLLLSCVLCLVFVENHAAGIRPSRDAALRTAGEIRPNPAVQADSNGMLPFLDIVQPSPIGNTVVDLSGLPALPQATFRQTSFALGTTQDLTMVVDPQPNDVYTLPGPGRQVLRFPTVRNFDGFLNRAPNGLLQIIEVSAADAPGITLLAGVDTNGDGQPQANEQTCRSVTASGSVARCVVDLRGTDRDVWAIVQVSAGVAGATYAVNVTNAQPGATPPDSVVDVTGYEVTPAGPGHVAAVVAFPLRFAWDTTLDAPGRYFGAVMIDAAPGLAGASGLLPFGITRATGHNDVARVGFSSLNGFVEPGETTTHGVFDVPSGLSKLSIRATSHSSISVDVARAPYPDFSASPELAGPPTGAAPIASFVVDASEEYVTDVSLPADPGRLYFVVHGTGENATNYGFEFSYSVAVPKFVVPGAYYNPQRSGHGIFVSQAGDQQALNWYTYLEDGTPVWYTAQQPRDPRQPNWVAYLERVTWDGSRINGRTLAGLVSLTRIDDSDAIFSWYLDGRHGSERVTRLGSGPCPSFNGVETSFNGAWYPPALAGSGMDVVALPGLQFATFYFYDDLGNPRWAVGANQPFTPSSAMVLDQYAGFCPACEHVAVTSQPIGNLNIDYAGPFAGQASAQLTFRPPLSGTWQMDVPIARLSVGAACTN